MRQKWTDDEIRRLRELYPMTRAQDIAAALGRSVSSVYNASRKHGLAKAREYMRATRDKVIEQAGRSSRFTKGMVPHNKGQKMRPETLEKLRPTLFQKGHRPHTWVPVGTEYTYARDGLRKVKVSDDTSLPRTSRWRFAHHLEWEKYNGPITEGGIVRFRDGNTSNVRIENLELITRKENALLNTIHRYPPEMVKVMKAVGSIKRIINNKRKNNGKEQAQ